MAHELLPYIDAWTHGSVVWQKQVALSLVVWTRSMPALVNILGRDGHICQQVLLRLLEGLRHHWQVTLLESGPDKHPEEAVIGFCTLSGSFVFGWQVQKQSSAKHSHRFLAHRNRL